ncbi:MAG: ABC transporter permease [Candidatus Rokuibacteriota bacterium]|nr:MAG: ABC transporter permease [Candidatus Rokubacteria bacterium]
MIRRVTAIYARLGGYLRPYWVWLAGGGLLALFVSAMDGAIAWLVKPAMDGIFIRRDLLMLKLLPLALLAVYVLKGLGRYAQSYLMAAVGERVIATIRRDLYRHIQRMPLAFFSDVHSAELTSRVIIDVNRLARLSSTVLVMALRQVGTIIALTAVMVSRDWVPTLFALFAFPFISVIVRAIGRRLYKINKRAQERGAQLVVLLQESFTGTKIVKAFGREAHEQERFDGLNQRLLHLSLKNVRADEITEPLMEIIGAVGIMAAIWYGGYRVINGETRIFNTVQQTTASVERVFEVMDMPPAIVDRPGVPALPGFARTIEFVGVSFRYADADADVLSDITLTVRKGEVVAFVGMSGAGKSTLMDLLPRFHDVTGGRILIDGHDLRDVTVGSLRAVIGIVTQENFLFNDTIRYNIGYGRPDAALPDIIQAARLAQAHEFIVATPDRYDTLVGERGVRLSGRGDVGSRRGERVPRAAGALRADTQPHRARDRAPALHGPSRRPDRGHPRGADSGGRTPRRAHRPRRDLPEALCPADGRCRLMTTPRRSLAHEKERR